MVPQWETFARPLFGWDDTDYENKVGEEIVHMLRLENDKAFMCLRATITQRGVNPFDDTPYWSISNTFAFVQTCYGDLAEAKEIAIKSLQKFVDQAKEIVANYEELIKERSHE